jgi:hypothetical protein
MHEKPRVVGVTGGALGLSAVALAFGVCCVAPWAVTLLGVAGAVLFARLAFIQPYVVAATIVLIGVAFWIVYRRPRTAAQCDFGRQMSKVLGLVSKSRSIYAWDIYMIYAPNAVWSGQDPPQPTYLMHQLPGLDNHNFPPWDGKVFATKVAATLAAGDQKN